MSPHFTVRRAVLAAIAVSAVSTAAATAVPLRDRQVIVDLAPSKLGTVKITPSGGAFRVKAKQYVLFVRSGLPKNYNKMVGTYVLNGALSFTAAGRTARVTKLRLTVTATGSCLSGLLKARRIQLMCGVRIPDIRGFWEPDANQSFPHLFAYRADASKIPLAALRRLHTVLGSASPKSLRGTLIVGGHVAGILLTPTPGTTHDAFSFASPYVTTTQPPAASPIEVGGITAATGTGVVTLSSPQFGLYSDVHKTMHLFDGTRIVMNAGTVELHATKAGVEHIVATGSVSVPVATNLGFVVLAPTNLMLTADGAAFVNGQLTSTAGKEWAEGQHFCTLRMEAPAL